MKDKFQEFTDSQWQILQIIIGDTRKRRHSLRTILNGIFWINNTGAQWRNLDSKYPCWQTVFYHFTRFKISGIWEQILDSLTELERISKGKEISPSLLAVDSQSVKIVQFTCEEKGIDGNKKINGRKRTILVDTDGLPFAIKVTAANISDNEAGILAVNKLKGKVSRLKKIVGDQGYKKTFKETIEKAFKWIVEIGQKPESSKGFIPQKNRWQVERSFSWLNSRRRLLRDVEKTVESSEAMLEIAFISIILNRLAK
jgi:putative transposase